MAKKAKFGLVTKPKRDKFEKMLRHRLTRHHVQPNSPLRNLCGILSRFRILLIYPLWFVVVSILLGQFPVSAPEGRGVQTQNEQGPRMFENILLHVAQKILLCCNFNHCANKIPTITGIIIGLDTLPIRNRVDCRPNRYFLFYICINTL